MIELPKQVSFVLEELNKNTYEAFIVGGCVRDSLMNKTPYDFDITTDATPQQIKQIFAKTYDTGLQHGTITVCIDKMNFEVTTYRIDGTYTDGRHPDSVVFTKKIEEDLSRRDFTMNAIAYNPKDGFVDFFEGQEDIKRNVIRAVGVAEKRFQEDGLRMLRAIRFSAQLNFDIDNATWLALKDNAYLIQNISCERIYSEFTKILLSENIHRISLLWKSGLLSLIVENSDDYMQKHGEEIIQYLLKCEKNISLRLALIMQHTSSKVAEKILKSLKVDNKTKKEVCTFVDNIFTEFSSDLYSVRKALSLLGVDNFKKIIYLKHCVGISVTDISENLELIIEQKDCINLREMKINGDHLKKLGIKDGKKIGLILNQLFDMVLHEPQKNNRKFLLAAAEKLNNNPKTFY